MKQRICKDCGNQVEKNVNRNRCRKCEYKNRVIRSRKTKQQCVDYKGGKCSKCGYNQCLGALDFHHLNPEEKTFRIAVSYKRFVNIKDELDKCILLCANCHREEHYDECDLISTEVSNEIRKEKWNKTCDVCKNEYLTGQHKRSNYCSLKCAGIAKRKDFPSKEELNRLKIEHVTWKKVSDFTGISTTTIYKILRGEKDF